MSNNPIEQHHSIRWYAACPWTLGLSTVMLLFNLGLLFRLPSGESLLTWLQYDRSAIVEGQLWRLVTGNLVHWSAEHFLLDVAVFLLIGFFYERCLGNSYPWILFLTCLVVGASALIFLPQMATYRGLSGVDSGLFAAVLCLECGQAVRDRRNWLFLLPTVGIFVLKLGYESATGRMFFGTESLGDLGQPVPLAHTAGAFAAVVFFGLQHLRSKEFFQQGFHPTKFQRYVDMTRLHKVHCRKRKWGRTRCFVFSELDELSGGREGGASREAPDDVPSFSPNLHRPGDCLAGRHFRRGGPDSRIWATESQEVDRGNVLVTMKE